jgi:L-aspartate oxidase
VVLHRARAVVLATGGLGQAYSRTTNPAEATGDGLALAWRAGARVGDLEFVQFHPTALDVGEDPMPLLTEALRGAGARLIDEEGHPIFDVPGGELQARDVVARGIWTALARGHRPLLDARGAVGDAFPERYPTVFEACQEHGLDPRVEPMPVAPAAHYHMGGVLVDADGCTSRPGLWAAGEVSCTGVHGANRLASNSLLEALVFGARAARSVAGALSRGPRPAQIEAVDGLRVPEPGTCGSQTARLRRVMWEKVGLVRTGEGLRDALEEIDALEAELPEGPSEARNALNVGRLVARAAVARPESRGGHFRADCPEARGAWRRRIVLSRSGDRELITYEPIPSATTGPAEQQTGVSA